MPLQEYLEAGQIVGTHGVRGEVRLQPWCDTPEQLIPVKKLYWDAGRTPVRVRCRPHKNMALVQIEGVNTVQEANLLRGKILFLHRADLKLPKGACFIRDLIGCRMIDADTEEDYGELTDVSPTGANDVYHMRHKDGREILIPAIPAVIVDKDIENGRILMRPMKGLLDDAD